MLYDLIYDVLRDSPHYALIEGFKPELRVFIDHMLTEGPDRKVFFTHDGDILTGVIFCLSMPHPLFGKLATEPLWAVHKDYRKTGVGKELLDQYECWAKNNNCTHINIDHMLTTDMTEYYKKRGYTKVSESFIKEIL
jgi:N-acetylglutamate synthase-like GNAT family acetyltransferase